jgi:hypothetical protein
MGARWLAIDRVVGPGDVAAVALMGATYDVDGAQQLV